jgi:hypothetical protein
MKKFNRVIDYIKVLVVDDSKKSRNDGFGFLTKIARLVLPQYRFTFPQMDWWKDEEFNCYLEKFDELHGFNTHRRWMLKQLLRMVDNVEGDTAECGVFRGAGSYLILQANASKDQRCVHHVFDSFEGLSEPDRNDGAFWVKGSLSASESIAESFLCPFSRDIDYKLYKGWIPARFDEVERLTFSFVHVDVDLYQPTLDSIEFFYPRLSTGAVLLCDDYGFDTCPGATKAIDDYLSDKKEKMLSLPDGGGFFVKGLTVK